jgi:hypothetical protein
MSFNHGVYLNPLSYISMASFPVNNTLLKTLMSYSRHQPKIL